MMPVAGITKPAGQQPRSSESPDQFRPMAPRPYDNPMGTYPQIQQPEPSPPGMGPRAPMAMGAPNIGGISGVGGLNVLSPPSGTAALAPWSFQVPTSLGQQPTQQQTRPQTLMPQMPAMPQQQPMQMPSFGLGDYSALTDPTPYNRAVDRGNRFIGSIPNNASPLTSFSPAFKGLAPNMTNALNSQWQNLGQGARDEAGLEFARKAGSEVPAFQLAQQLGLRGLQNDYSDLNNLFYGNNIARTTGGLNSMLQLLGALGSFF